MCEKICHYVVQTFYSIIRVHTCHADAHFSVFGVHQKHVEKSSLSITAI
jgi:hypothetical protein